LGSQLIKQIVDPVFYYSVVGPQANTSAWGQRASMSYHAEYYQCRLQIKKACLSYLRYAGKPEQRQNILIIFTIIIRFLQLKTLVKNSPVQLVVSGECIVYMELFAQLGAKIILAD